MCVFAERILPDSFNTWDNVDEDNCLAEFCTQGLGQLYLSGVDRDRDPGRAIPEGAVVECSVEWMGEYTCRKPWVKVSASELCGSVHSCVLCGSGRATQQIIMTVVWC